MLCTCTLLVAVLFIVLLLSAGILLLNQNLVRLFAEMDSYKGKQFDPAAEEELKEKSLTANGRGMLCSFVLFLICILINLRLSKLYRKSCPSVRLSVCLSAR